MKFVYSRDDFDRGLSILYSWNKVKNCKAIVWQQLRRSHHSIFLYGFHMYIRLSQKKNLLSSLWVKMNLNTEKKITLQGIAILVLN